MQGLSRRIPVHAFLLAAHPIVSLLAFNIAQIYTQDAIKSLLIALALTVFVIAGLRLLSGNWQVAGLLTSLLVLWFFLYGRVYVPLKSISVLGVVLGRHRYLLAVWSVPFLAAALWLRRSPRVIPDLTMAFNVFSAILICLPAFQIVAFQLRNRLPSGSAAASSLKPSISWTSAATPPDIYYIVLDQYVRSDVLEQQFGLSNATFLAGLRQLGFYVADCAQSNYSRTSLSFASTFNMEYLQDLRPGGFATDDDPALLLPYLKHNLVRQQLEKLGYKTIVFWNPWGGLVWDDAAIVYRSTGASLLSPFESLLLSTTAARVYLDARVAESRQIANYANYMDTLYALDSLPKVPGISGPKFVFVHLVIPHPPFVFGPDGQKIDIPYDADAGNIYTEQDFKRGYVAAVEYIDTRMLEIIPRLIQDSRTPPIIVVAGDHGAPWGGPQNAVRNLEAFYTPGSPSPFYKTVTPVNIFRVVFDTYFNGSLGLLQDRSYNSDDRNYFKLQEIPNSCG